MNKFFTKLLKEKRKKETEEENGPSEDTPVNVDKLMEGFGRTPTPHNTPGKSILDKLSPTDLERYKNM